MSLNKKITFMVAGSILSIAAQTALAESQFPNKSIKLVVGYAPGGGTDLCFRSLAKVAGDELKQPIVVENKPGAGSSLSISYLTKQKSDGYTLAVLATGAVLNQFSNKDISYDVKSDITPIALLGHYQVGILTRPDSEYEDIKDIIEAAKQKELTFSTAGVGTPQHLSVERLSEMTDANFIHVPYKGGVDASLALMSGDVDIMVNTAEWAPFVRDKKLKLLNAVTEERIQQFDYAPTLKEEGIDIVAPSIYGLVGPKNMDQDVIDTIQKAFKVAGESEDFKSCADVNGLRVDYLDSSEFKSYIADIADTWGPLAKKYIKN